MYIWSPEQGVRAENKFEEIMAETFLNLLKTVSTQITNPKLEICKITWHITVV